MSTPAPLAAAMRELSQDKDAYDRCRRQALASAHAARWEAVLDIL